MLGDELADTTKQSSAGHSVLHNTHTELPQNLALLMFEENCSHLVPKM